MRRLINCLVFILNLLFFVLPTPGYADKTSDKTLSPYFLIENGDPSVERFPLKETRVVVNINGVIADVIINQKYLNDGIHPINARYIFPASTRAAVHGMTMTIGEEVIMAQIKKRKSAQEEFDKAKKSGKSASLLKQQRPNVFSMNIANIMPQDTIDIQLHYTELLVPTDGTYEFVYPTVVGPRFSNQPEAGASESDKWIKNPYLKKGSPPLTMFDIVFNISTGIPIQEVVCNSHQTEIMWESKTVAKVILAKTDKFTGDRDVILNYRLAGKAIESGLMLFKGMDENFFMLMVQPPERIRMEDILPREYIFVVDISGSMHGFPLNTAKKLVKTLIGKLRPTDRFNVILFAGGSRIMAPSSLPATNENLHRAVSLIDKRQGGGGTELLAALNRGLSLPRDEAFSRSIIIVTDGYIAAERDVFKLIRQNLNRTNVFSFGIGSSVNRYLIEGIAKAGQGEAFVVTNPRDANGAAERFRKYVQSPVLNNIAVKYNHFETYDIEPVQIPDLFAKRPVIVFGKWRGEAEGMITLTGKGGTGDYVQDFNVAQIKPLKMNGALRYLWARTRIARLSDFNLKRGNAENTAEITTLGLTYSLLTAYTSFIAVHEAVRNPEAKGQDVDQPLPLPLHVSNLAVGGSVSAVPEPEMYVLLIIAALILSIIIGIKACVYTTLGKIYRHQTSTRQDK